MKRLKSFIWGADALLICFLSFYTCLAFAQTVVAPADFFTQVLTFIASWGGISSLLKVAGIITIIISSMKVTFLNSMIWSKLGSFQAWLAPILGLLAGILGLGMGGASITAASVFAYISAGAGAIVLHELLDTIKVIPGIGAIWITIIDIIEGATGGGTPVSVLQAQQKALADKIAAKH